MFTVHLTSGYFLPAPDNSNFFRFPLNVRAITSRRVIQVEQWRLSILNKNEPKVLGSFESHVQCVTCKTLKCEIGQILTVKVNLRRNNVIMPCPFPLSLKNCSQHSHHKRTCAKFLVPASTKVHKIRKYPPPSPTNKLTLKN